jgi:DNA-binding transcriptional regulator YiaG
MIDKDLLVQIEAIQKIVGKDKIAINTSELAALLGVSSSTVDGWRKTGKGISYLKPNSKSPNDKARVLYPIVYVAKWIIVHTVQTV